ncbi:MAG: hypothetical protein JJU29_21775 [Verrucomicrobia bacterium]|nr:hypothetical protein [Verrucomicrobiota bacterium]MCH8512475.1 hypothetical protein [Kiritimatiellia bacterium]
MNAQDFIQKLSPTLFWDVDPATVDASRHKRFVICRVMDRGTREDVRLAWDHYSNDEIREALLGARTLHAKTIAYFAVIFQLPREVFRAYDSKKDGTWNA